MAEEGGSEINVGLGQGSMDSTESRWVFQDEDDSEIDDDDDDVFSQRSAAAGGLDSEEEEENAEQRLIRTGPRIDSFDVEALEVPGAVRSDYEVASGVLVRCAFLLCESTVNEICVFNFTLFRSISFLVTIWLFRKENWIRIVWLLLVFVHFTRRGKVE
jgi:hypothetical protein